MVKITKRAAIMHEKVDLTKHYEINEAISLLKMMATAKFIESVDVAINLGIDARKSEQNVRGTTILPHGTGRYVRIAVFAQGKNAEAAKSAGADLIGMEDLAEKIKKGEKINFDVVIATADSMHIVNQLGQILGPRDLMPNLKVGTITQNVAETIKNFKIGQICYRNDKNGIVHATIGKIDLDNKDLKENLEALLLAVIKSKPPQNKGTYIKKISLSTTMGVGIKINCNSLSSTIN